MGTSIHCGLPLSIDAIAPGHIFHKLSMLEYPVGKTQVTFPERSRLY